MKYVGFALFVFLSFGTMVYLGTDMIQNSIERRTQATRARDACAERKLYAVQTVDGRYLCVNAQ